MKYQIRTLQKYLSNGIKIILVKQKNFLDTKDKVDENTFHHVGIYSYTINSIKDFVKLPTSKNEKLLNLEQYRAMDAGIGIGVTLVNNIPPSIDTKEDLNLIETIIRENNE